MYPHLLSEGKIGNVTIRNRTVMSAMVSGFANYDGTPSDRLIGYYEERAKNGLGLLITGATRVNNFYAASAPMQLSMASDRLIEPFGKMVDRMHSLGTKVFCQIHHPGREGICMMAPMCLSIEYMGRLWPGMYKMIPLMFNIVNKSGIMNYVNIPMEEMTKFSKFPATVAPSKVPCEAFGQRTRALLKWEIKRLEQQFIAAAKRVQLSGADGVELHAAHGYLIEQFMSSLSNRRKDEYGGSLDNRMRFAVNIIKGIKKECGEDFPVAVRLSVDEFFGKVGKPHQGIEMEEGVEIARRLEKAGIDAIDVSSGTYDTVNYAIEPVTFEPGWRTYLSKAVKEAVSIPVIGAGVIRTPEQAEQLLTESTLDFISMGRPFLSDPEWVSKAKEGRPEDIKRCISCIRCFESVLDNMIKGDIMECTVNPKLGNEKKFASPKADGKGRAVVVIGAGPAGLKTAEVAADRGFKVVLFERSESSGGQVKLAEAAPGRKNIGWCVEDLQTSDRRSGVEFRFGSEPTTNELKALNPFAIIVATGSKVIVPKVPGVDRKNVYTVEEALNGSVKLKGKRVAVIGGGMTGLETAEKIAEDGNEIFIVEMLDRVAKGVYLQNRIDVLDHLDKYNPEYLTSYKLVEIGDGEITLEHVKSCRQIKEKADAVVLAIGVCSENKLAQELKSKFERVYTIGDARKPGYIHNAVRDGFNTAWNL